MSHLPAHRATRTRFLVVTLTGVLLLAACATEDDAPPSDAVPEPTAIEAPPGGFDAQLLGTEEIVPQIEAAIADAAERFGVEPEAVAVARSLRVSWSDGSLGCPEEGMMYTQAIVDGYLLTLEVDGRRYDYHGAMGGDPFLCERD
jgi:hypothetical protein